MKISKKGSKTGTMSYNTHISGCPKAKEANCQDLCYVRGTYAFRKKVEPLDLDNLQQTIDLLMAGKKIFVEAMLAVLKSAGILNSITFRIHERGDFLSPEHFEAWTEIATRFPKTHFWAYTKSYHVIGNTPIPDNFTLFISLTSNDKKRYRKAALGVAHARSLSIAYASVRKESAIALAKKLGLPLISCPEQLLAKIRPEFTCQDCCICWEYPKRFFIWFKAHGIYKGAFNE